MVRRWWVVLIVLAVAGSLVGCGGDGSDEVFDDGGEDAVSAASDDGSGGSDETPAELSSEQEGEVVAAYEEFLAVSDDARFGDGEARARLAEIAAPGVVAQIEAWTAENDDLADDELNVVDWVSYPNITAVGATDAGVVVEDCVEADKEPVVDISGNGMWHFVDQQATLRLVDGQWIVAELDVRNDGTWRELPEEYGCVPEYHQERITGSLDSVMDGADAILADPAAATDQQIEAALAEPMRTETRDQTIPGMVELGWALDGPADVVDVEFVGTKIQDWKVVVVDACVEFPEGRSMVDAATGETVTDPGLPDPYEPGHREAQRVEIRFDDSDGGIVDRVAAGDNGVSDDFECEES